MRLGLSQDQQQAPTRSAAGIMPRRLPHRRPKRIAYDYVAMFMLTGVTRQSREGCESTSASKAPSSPSRSATASSRPRLIQHHLVPPMAGRLISSTALSIAAADASCRIGLSITSPDWVRQPVSGHSARSPSRCCSCPAPPSVSKLKKSTITSTTKDCRTVSSCCTATKYWATEGMTMNLNHACDVHRDTAYSNVCQVCGVPLDAGYFDVASIKKAPRG